MTSSVHCSSGSTLSSVWGFLPWYTPVIIPSSSTLTQLFIICTPLSLKVIVLLCHLKTTLM